MTLSPNITRHILPSGLTILIETLPYVRSVSLGYYLRSGSAVESEEHSGASHFLEHLVFKGTARRTTSDIAQIVDILGGDVDAFTGKEYTSFYAHVLDEQVATALDLLTDIVVAPAFTAEDVESERSVILEEIKMVEDTPDDLVHEMFVTAFWPDHPLGNPILGGGMSSRLFQRIREKEGLVYTVLSYHNGYLNGGYEAVYAACVPRNLRRVLSITLEEMKKIKADGVTAAELGAAKLHLKGSILLSLESTVSRMSGIARQEYYFGRQFTADEIITAIDAVTLDDIHAVAQTIVDPDSLSLTLLGNLKSPGISMDALREAVA